MLLVDAVTADRRGAPSASPKRPTTAAAILAPNRTRRNSRLPSQLPSFLRRYSLDRSAASSSTTHAPLVPPLSARAILQPLPGTAAALEQSAVQPFAQADAQLERPRTSDPDIQLTRVARPGGGARSGRHVAPKPGSRRQAFASPSGANDGAPEASTIFPEPPELLGLQPPQGKHSPQTLVHMISMIESVAPVASSEHSPLQALLRIITPMAPGISRPPIELVAVVDNSGSMDGEKLRALADGWESAQA